MCAPASPSATTAVFGKAKIPTNERGLQAAGMMRQLASGFLYVASVAEPCETSDVRSCLSVSSLVWLFETGTKGKTLACFSRRLALLLVTDHHCLGVHLRVPRDFLLRAGCESARRESCIPSSFPSDQVQSCFYSFYM